MTFQVRETELATRDGDAIFLWLHERSPEGARSWLDAYDAMLDRLAQRAPSFGLAPESEHTSLDVRQALFKTRKGRTYRALFTVMENEVFVLRVRGPGQRPMRDVELG